MDRIFSGIKPTHNGIPHLGNYLGALKQFVRSDKIEQFYCVADLHATTTPFNPSDLKIAILNTAITLKAIGIDTNSNIIFQQSRVSTHSRLFVLLSHIASLGPLERMTQFKDKSQKSEGREIPFGLLSYPLLMAADILAYKANLVPVGDDQHQHLQLTQELAQRFNFRFNDGKTYFPLPKPLFTVAGKRVMSIRDPGRKMSKTEPDGAIFLDDSKDVVAKKFKRAVSDSLYLPSEVEGLADRPAVRNLIDILAGIENVSLENICLEMGGKGNAALKDRLISSYEAHIGPIRNNFEQYSKNTDYIKSILENGNLKAQNVSIPIVEQAEYLMGLKY